MASEEIFSKTLQVLEWLDVYGDPYMLRRFGIGVDRQTATQLCDTHDKFRRVAHNTHRNAEQIFHTVHLIINDSSIFANY